MNYLSAMILLQYCNQDKDGGKMCNLGGFNFKKLLNSKRKCFYFINILFTYKPIL